MGIPQRALASPMETAFSKRLADGICIRDFPDSRNQDVDFFLDEAPSRNTGAITPVKW